MENKNLETEIRKFNNKGYNNQKAILWFIDKSRKPENAVCEICESAYQRSFCNLCKEIIANHNVLDIYNKIIDKGAKFKLEI